MHAGAATEAYRAASRPSPATSWAAGALEHWSMDFVHDTLSEGRPYRILTVVDQWSRSSPVIEAGCQMSGEIVGRVLDRVLGD